MKISELIECLEHLAPLDYQEDYDNAGLIVGQPDQTVTSALITLDCTEEVVDEAIGKKCDLIIAHHPIVFSALKKFNQKSYVERVIAKAIKNDLALYAIHTNLDQVPLGVNASICKQLGLTNGQILAPKQGMLKKLVTFVPITHADLVRNALFTLGVGCIGKYEECSFSTEGLGTFKAGAHAHPFVSSAGTRHQEAELRIEMIYPIHLERALVNKLLQVHPYEEVAYDLYPITNTFQSMGLGMIAEFPTPMDERSFLALVKDRMPAPVIKHTALRSKMVKKVAVCGGSGSFLLQKAIEHHADAFISADFKYHEFFDAEGSILIADIGHFESEHLTKNLLYEAIREKFTNFPLQLTEINTNPVKYFT